MGSCVRYLNRLSDLIFILARTWRCARRWRIGLSEYGP